ncbi:glycine cleavage system protein H [Lactobacillus sp. YT155]|uniref:glycine cleavage system protein H n=1 Tax=Lactobacillus sp. YT155 TaxID=3060955 RepID=UPI00265F78C2|nr:glycine cleavage system protein H [Lactobacillus sp. YT155]MDO1604984.1 glycine cleavage system protein H [Lactobacillus sp. YT155]
MNDYLKIIENDKNITIGLKKDAEEELGEVKFVDFLTNNGDVKKGETFASIEAKKAVIELEAPFSGAITSVNTEVEDKPETIYEDNTWLIKMVKA